MLAALALDLSMFVRRLLWVALVSFAGQSPRDRLFAVIVIFALIVDFGIPLLTFGCLSWGGCFLPRP